MYQIQGGNVLDASNRVGSGGLNPAVRSYDFGAGNRLMSGNVMVAAHPGYSRYETPARWDTAILPGFERGMGSGRLQPFLPSIA
jgi:hypothetical protein